MRASGGLAWLDGLGPQRIRPGLARTRALLAGLGNPQDRFRSVLIGGTNGKGSTAAALASILNAAGIRAGLYTSPHLVAVTERIRIDERDISEGALDSLLSLVASISAPGDRSPTYFEAMTVAALESFRRARVSIAVVEVGIGGRWDATNVLQPDLSIVTNVGADHLEVLGPSLADVARQKAGIFRNGIPALTSAQGEGREVLYEEATRIGARLIDVPPTSRFDSCSPLKGAHQRANLALAAAAASALTGADEETTRRGVAATRWPGRLQEIRRPGRRDLLLDGAHNPEGARELAAYLDEAGLSGKIDLLFGGLKEKDLSTMFGTLAPRARRIVLVTTGSPRAETAATLGARFGIAPENLADDPMAGVRLLERDPVPGAGPILATGSLVLVGEILGGIRGETRSEKLNDGADAGRNGLPYSAATDA